MKSGTAAGFDRYVGTTVDRYHVWVTLAQERTRLAVSRVSRAGDPNRNSLQIAEPATSRKLQPQRIA